jgi:putative heme-binding domain-containing protein
VRDAKFGWTPALRRRFAAVLGELRAAKGGHSFPGFLERMTKDFLAGLPAETAGAEREALAAAAAGKREPTVRVSARGPGRTWTVDAVAALGAKLESGRDYREGMRAYHAAQCAQCHGTGEIGGLIGGGGPDLTTLFRRFSLADVATAVIEPSRTISDQYRNLDYRLRDRRTVTGRVAADLGDVLEIRTVLLSDVRERVKKADVAEIEPSIVSPMPSGLFDALSEGELLDLLAFLRAGGDPRDPCFAPRDADGFLELFAKGRPGADGLGAFTYDPRFWTLEDGEITGRTTAERPTEHNTFLVWSGEVRDFELEAEIKLVGNNSGIQYRSTLFAEHRLRGPQLDVHPHPPYLGMHYEEGGRGIVAESGTRTTLGADGATTREALGGAALSADPSAWHVYRVVARGRMLEHFLDGAPVCTVIDDSPAAAKGGRIGVQIHAGPPTEVRVRKLRLKRLEE